MLLEGSVYDAVAQRTRRQVELSEDLARATFEKTGLAAKNVAIVPAPPDSPEKDDRVSCQRGSR